jgi:hypothetical protein
LNKFDQFRSSLNQFDQVSSIQGGIQQQQIDLCMIQDSKTLNQDKWKNKNNIINLKKREQS